MEIEASDQGPTFAHDSASAARAVEVVDTIAGTCPEVAARLEGVAGTTLDVFAVLWGWWVRTCRLGTLVTSAYGINHEAEASPLVRSMSEHAMSMLWLSDEGVEGHSALIAERRSHQRALVRDMAAVDWDHSALHEHQESEMACAQTRQGVRQYFEQLSLLYEDAPPYAVYRLESSHTHPTWDSAAGYFEPTTETFRARSSSWNDSLSAPLEAARCILFASLVILRHVEDQNLRLAVENAFEHLGVRFELPDRVATPIASSVQRDGAVGQALRSLYTKMSNACREDALLLPLLRAGDDFSDLEDATRRDLKKKADRAMSHVENAMVALAEVGRARQG